jgi:deazaflavin-dependent oxidoreductase (nitroreductase family)
MGDHGPVNGPVREALRRATRAARPLALRSAGKERSNTAIVVHAGRRSGRTYRTPVVAAREQDGFVIALPYGERTDWAKNVLAKGSASLITGGHTYEVDRPEVVPLADVATAFRPREQRLQQRFRVGSALRVHLA